jgi:hypothetical protein
MTCPYPSTSGFTSPGNHRGGGDRLAEGRWRTQHPGIVWEHSGNGSLLVETQSADKRKVDRLAADTLITQDTGDIVVPQ